MAKNDLPFVPDLQAIQAIYGPGLPPKWGNKGPMLNQSILASVRIMDEQDALRSIEWFTLPPEIPQDLLERMLYYRGSVMFFYMKETNRFYALPYAGKEIDCYGRYQYATALPFTGQMESGKKKEAPWIDGRYWKIVYEPVFDEWTPEMMNDCCVLINDYSRQLSQKIIPRAQLQEPLMQVEAEMIPFMRTALLNGTGIEGMRVETPDGAAEVRVASDSLIRAAINGDRWIPVNSGINSEILSHSQGAKTEEYLLALQSLDNYRLSFHGLESGGLFQKKAHMLQAEQQGNVGNAGLVMADKLQCRQSASTIINTIWGLGVWADTSEIVSEVDRNMDGEMDNDDSEVDAAMNDTTGGYDGGDE